MAVEGGDVPAVSKADFGSCTVVVPGHGATHFLAPPGCRQAFLASAAGKSRPLGGRGSPPGMRAS
jgi:hypothetical protein